jgi:hypothetical protein
MSMRAGSTIVCCLNNNCDLREEDNVAVIIVLACTSNHGVLAVVVIIIVAVALRLQVDDGCQRIGCWSIVSARGGMGIGGGTTISLFDIAPVVIE